MKDVAEQAGVSPTTASLILSKRPGFTFSPDTIQRVQEAAKNLGYKNSLFSVNHPRGSTKLISLYIGELFMLRQGSRMEWTPQVYRLFSEVTSACFDHHLFPIALSHNVGRETADGIPERLNLLVQSGVGGILALGPEPEIMPHLEAFARGGTVVVHVFGERTEIPGMVDIDVDNRVMGLLATRRLSAAGHKRVALVRRKKHFLSIEDRCIGYRSAMETQGIQPIILDCETDQDRANVDLSPFESALAQQQVVDNLAKEIQAARVDAIFSTCAGTTALALEAVHALDYSIPKEFGLIGVDLAQYRLCGAITHMSGQWDLYGRKAVDTLVDYIGGRFPSDPRRVLFEPVFVEGKTCRI